MAGSLESSRRRTLRSSRSRSSGGQLRGVRTVVVGQCGHVGRAARRVADRIDEDLDAGQAGIRVEPRPELDDLGVDGRSRVADRLDVELPELAVAARLRAVVAEHRADLVQLHGLRPRLEPVLDVGPDDPGRRLGAERPRFGLVGPGHDPEQLLLDDVRDLADASLEDRGLLEHRRLDAAVAVSGGQVRGEPLQAGPGGRVGWQEVARAPWGLEGRHRCESRASGPRRRGGQPRSRWTLMTSLRFSMRPMTRASCDTEWTWSVAVTTAV